MRSLPSLCLLLLLIPAQALAILPTYDEPTRTLYLVRHGEYEHGKECGDDGCGLVALGRQQARMLTDRLLAMPFEFTSIQASTMTRARETGALVAARFPHLELTLHDDIRECTPTTIRQDIMDELEPGEAAECEAQLEASWKRLFVPATGPEDEHDLVICHGNVIRWFTTRAIGAPDEQWLQMSIANCSLTVIQVRADGSFKVVTFADSGHMPWSMTTYPGVEAAQ